MSEKMEILVFSDGSCMNNGRNDAYGGIGVHFPNGELDDISKAYRRGLCTNQKAELYAILTTLRYIHENIDLNNCSVIIKTDSEYSINCVTKWVNGWVKNGWMTTGGKPVANKELIESIYKYHKKYDITLEHVDAHTKGTDFDSVANDVADQLAAKARDRMAPSAGTSNTTTAYKPKKSSGPKRFNVILKE